MSNVVRCQNCGRSLTDDEIYCYFCELEIEKLKMEKEIIKKLKSYEILKNLFENFIVDKLKRKNFENF